MSDDEDDGDDNRHQAVATDEAGWADLPPQAAAEAKAFRDENAGKQSDERLAATTSTNTTANGKQGKLQEIFPKLTPANLSKLLDSKYELERERGLNERRGQDGEEGGPEANPSGVSLRPGRVEYVSSFRAQPGKRIAIPVRVEPKVFFANERTSKLASFAIGGSLLTPFVRSSLLGRILSRSLRNRYRNLVVLRPARYDQIPDCAERFRS